MDAVQQLGQLPDPIQAIMARNSTPGKGVSQPQADLQALTTEKANQEGQILQKKSDAGIDQAKQAAGIQDTYQEKTQGLQDEFKQESAEHPVDTKFTPPPPMIADIASIGMLMTAVAGMTGGKGRYSAMNGMAAMNGAMEGIHKGDLENTQKAMDTFNENLKANTEWHREKLAELKEAMTQLGTSRDTAMAKLKVLEAEFEGSVTANQIRVGNLSGAITNLEGVVKHNDKMEERSATLNQQMQMALFKHNLTKSDGAAPASPEGRESAASQAASGMPLSQVVPGYGKQAVVAREQARVDAIKLIMKNQGMSAEQAGTELANRTIEFQSGKKSSGQLTAMLGATRQAVKQLDYNIEETKKDMAKLKGSDLSPLINAVIRGEEKWTGDPAYSALFFHMSATAMESARLLSGGQASVAQLHQGAQEEARKWANVNMTPDSFISGVAPAMLAEGHARIKTYEESLNEGRRAGDAPNPSGKQHLKPGEESAYDEWKRKNGLH